MIGKSIVYKGDGYKILDKVLEDGDTYYLCSKGSELITIRPLKIDRIINDYTIFNKLKNLKKRLDIAKKLERENIIDNDIGSVEEIKGKIQRLEQ